MDRLELPHPTWLLPLQRVGLRFMVCVRVCVCWGSVGAFLRLCLCVCLSVYLCLSVSVFLCQSPTPCTRCAQLPFTHSHSVTHEPTLTLTPLSRSFFFLPNCWLVRVVAGPHSLLTRQHLPHHDVGIH